MRAARLVVLVAVLVSLLRADLTVFGVNWPYRFYGDFGSNAWGHRGVASDGWVAEVYTNSQCFSNARWVAANPVTGNPALAFDASCVPRDEHRAAGEIYTEPMVNSPVACPVAGPKEVNLEGVTVRLRLCFPAGSAGPQDRRNGFQFYFKSRQNNYPALYSPWANIDPAWEGRCVDFTFVLSSTGAGDRYGPFDVTQVALAGIKIGTNSQALAGDAPIRGTFYLERYEIGTTPAMTYSFARPGLDGDFAAVLRMAQGLGYTQPVVRLFVFVDGRAGINWNADGSASGLDATAYSDMDALLESAQRMGVRVMPVLVDFLWCGRASSVSGVQIAGRSDVLRSPSLRDSVVERVLKPFVQRYANHPAIFAWEIINEPEWVTSGISGFQPDASANDPVTLEEMRAFVSAAATAIRGVSTLPVTVGSARRSWAALWKDSGVTLHTFHHYDSNPDPFPWADKSELALSGAVLVTEVPTANSLHAPDGYFQASRFGNYDGLMFWSCRGSDTASNFPAGAEGLSGLTTIGLASSPAGLSLVVDGMTIGAPWTTYWKPGPSHTLSAPSPQNVGASRFVFSGWSDGGNRTHSVPAPAAATDYTAAYTTTGPLLGSSGLRFGANRSTAAVTPSQEVTVEFLQGMSPGWTAVSDRAWLRVSPAAGSGTGKITVSVLPSALPATGTYSGTVTVSAPAAGGASAVLLCWLTVIQLNAAPFGSFDTPADGAAVASSIPVTGWALDDIGVTGVQIWRDRVASEGTGGLIYIGDAVFVPGARTDVEAAYPTWPLRHRAGWGYMLLTNFLPGSGAQARGNGTYRLYAIATDVEGKQTTLGSKTITVDNVHAAKPFGAIDTPGQGETVDGSAYVNFGWALTPQPAQIALDGSTINVFVDGAPVGTVTYNQSRSDIVSLFPGYANSAGGVGYRRLDTTQMTNGMHTIAWSVYDNQGRGDGVGSRYFYVLNAASGAVATPKLARLGRASAAAQFRTGYGTGAALRALERIDVEELERVEIQLPEGAWTGFSRVGAELRPLPVGSLLDGQSGVFTWQLGPGFLGRHELLFRSGERSVPVEVRIRAKDSAARAVRE